ncbi:MAG: hypothetical protein JXA52_06015 [Planctomycetes bacterium]|nr:hypothetical protein [Planctomycetota bacterium]
MSYYKYLGIIILALMILIISGCECMGPPEEQKEEGNIAIYKRQLEEKLLSQYRARPDFGNDVSRVELEATKDILTDETGMHKRVEWAQLVYDRWGQRIPELEQEYFVIEFGPEQYKAYGGEPSVKVGVMARGVYSEHQPVRAELVESTRVDSGIRYCPACGASVDKPGICSACLRKASGKEIDENTKPEPEPQGNCTVPAEETPAANIMQEEENPDFSDEVERTIQSIANFSSSAAQEEPEELEFAEFLAGDPFQ